SVMAAPEGQVDRAAIALKKKDLGNAAFKERRYHKAIQLYTESLRMEPNHLVFGNRAQSFIHLHQYELALRDLNEAMRINSTFAKNINRRAKVLSQLGMTSEAIKDSAAVLRLAPKDKAAHAEAMTLNGKENARIVDVKQWNSGEEFEEDEMIEIPITSLEQPTDSSATPPTVSSEESISETTMPPLTDALPADAVVDTVAPAAPSSEDTVEKKEEPVEEPTVPAVDTVSEVLSSETDTDLVTVLEGAPALNDDEVEDTVAPVEDTVEQKKEEEDEARLTEKDTAPEDADATLEDETALEDTVAVETVSPSEDTVAPLAATVLPTSPSMSTRSCTTTTKTSDETYSSALEPGSRTSNETYAKANEPERTSSNASWDEMKDASFSSISDIGSSVASADNYTTSPTTPKETEDEEEEETQRNVTAEGSDQVSIAESSSTASVIAETTLEQKKEEEVAIVEKKEEEATVLKKEEKEATVLEKKDEQATVAMNKDQEVTVVEKPKKEKKGKREVKVAEPSVENPPPARNFSDFCSHFSHLKHNSKAFGKYFLSMSPSSLPSIFSNLLDVEHLKAIVDGLTETANDEVADLSLISSSLFIVSLLPRFDLLVLFMNDDDKKKAFALIDLLPATAETKQIRDHFE
ncbi:hypothetical protein PMAYCL1PPCAC_19804, partial [Pristionchus mayeri]